MKRTIITIMAVVCMFVAIGGVIYTKNQYENKLEDMSAAYEKQIDELKNENNDLKSSMADMDEQIWWLMNDEEYKIRISHGKETYI